MLRLREAVVRRGGFRLAADLDLDRAKGEGRVRVVAGRVDRVQAGRGVSGHGDQQAAPCAVDGALGRRYLYEGGGASLGESIFANSPIGLENRPRSIRF